MIKIIPTIRTMTINETRQKGRYSPGLVLEHQGHTFNLNAGTSDTGAIFSHSIYLYALTISSSLGYIGLDAYVPNEPDAINTIFLHSEQDMVDVLGARWKRFSLKTLTLKLADHLI